MIGQSHDFRSEASRVVNYRVAAIALAVFAAATYLVTPRVGGGFTLVAFPLTVLVAAWLGGFKPSLLTTAGATLVAGFVSLRSELWPSGAVSLLLFGATGLLISLVVLHIRDRADRDRLARADVERQLRLTDQLHQLAATLLQRRTTDEVVEVSLPELLHALGLNAGALLLLSDDATECRLVHALGYDDPGTPATARWPVAPDSSLGKAMTRREVTVLDAPLTSSGAGTEVAAHPVLESDRGDVVVPIAAAGKAVGAFLLRIPHPRPLADDEREFLIRAARHLGQALDGARLYESAERARADAEALRVRADSELRERQKAEEALRLSETRYRALAARTSRLYALSAGLSEAVSLKAVATAVVRHGKVVVGASAGSVSMLVESGTHLEALHSEGHGMPSMEASRRIALSKGLCSTAAVETRRPIFVGSFDEWQERYPESAAVAADGGYVSSAALPLMADGSVMGVLAFHFTLPVNFDDEYVALLTSVAQHCAQAVDRARLYETAEHARAEAEAANRSKDDFLSTISHELRTPLNAMLGWSAMLRGGSLDPARTQRAIEAIFNNATRQGRLIEELLDVSRIVAGRASFDRQDVDLGENVRGAVESMMPLAAAKGVELRVGAPAGITVVADPRRLEQVFLNLLSNAVKFTPQGGRISVELSASDGAAEVRVADNGTGIEPSFLPHVFDRFRQADSAPTRAAGGLGLGLFISRQLVEAQAGTISAASAGSGRGSTFIVSLPAVRGASASRHVSSSVPPGPEPDTQEPMPALDGISVLLVDDEPDAREVMASTLESCGATVISAASAREALETLSHTEIDLLLSDIAMPGQDGYALIRDIRALPSARLATLPAAAVTAHARDDERDRALSAGFHMHLTKPVHPSTLASAVAALAGTRVR